MSQPANSNAAVRGAAYYIVRYKILYGAYAIGYGAYAIGVLRRIARGAHPTATGATALVNQHRGLAWQRQTKKIDDLCAPRSA